MRTLVCAGTFAILLIVGCQQTGSQHPASPAATPFSQAQPVYDLRTGDESLVALFDITLDPATLEATVSPRRGVQAQPPQAQTYDLDIANFLRPDSFRVRGVTRDGNGNIQLTFQHSHPFPAPDFSAAITGQNRADLGYTGRLMILADGATQTFFGGTIRTDPATVLAADGYLHTGDLLATTGLTNNTFPYVLLADDGEDNRLTESNGGTPQGSYNPGLGGWQRDNIGPNGTGWTGYDYVHGGQTITNDFTLSGAVLTGSAYEFSTAILIKYTDPRGQGGRSRRFPPQPADVLAFAYRLPYATLDASKSVATPMGVIGTSAGSSATLDLALRDWDAAAFMAPGIEIGGELDVTLIEAGGAGEPVATIDVPSLNGSEQPLLPAGGTSGVPGDEIQYSGTVTNTLGSAPTGTVHGLVRFIDPADTIDDSAIHFGVDPTTIAADPNRALATRTYQAIPITIAPAGTPPVISAVNPVGTIGCPGAAVQFSATASGSPTSWSWNFGGGAIPNTSPDAMPNVTLGSAATYNGSVTATNIYGTSPAFNFSFTVSSSGGYNTHFFNTTPAGNSGYYPDAELYAGRPIVTSMRHDGTNYFIELSTSAVAVPNAAGDWTTSIVTSYAGAAPTLYQTSFQNMLVHNDRIVIAFNNDTTDRMNIAIANVTAPTIPGPSDWTIYQLDPTAVVGLTGSQTPDGVLRASMAIHNGRVMVAYGDQQLDDCILAMANVDPPLAATDWTIITVESTGSRGPWTDVISYDDGTGGGNKLWIAHRDESGFNGHISKCSVATPSGSAAEWTHFNIPNSSFGGRAARLRAIDRAGSPRLLYIHSTWTTSGGGPALRAHVSNVQNPGGVVGDWTVYNIELYASAISQMLGVDVEIVSGLPVVAFYDNLSTTTTSSGVLGIARATNNSLGLATDWAVTFPDSDNPGGCWPDLVVLAGGQPAVVHRVGSRTSAPGYGMKFGVDLCN